MDLNTVYKLEKSMWDAAKNRNREEFLQIVSEDAVMVCGGFRCSGKEYADIISVFDCKSYSMEHFEIVNQDEKSVQVHYVILAAPSGCNKQTTSLIAVDDEELVAKLKAAIEPPAKQIDLDGFTKYFEATKDD